jgi:hypothetical protein
VYSTNTIKAGALPPPLGQSSDIDSTVIIVDRTFSQMEVKPPSISNFLSESSFSLTASDLQFSISVKPALEDATENASAVSLVRLGAASLVGANSSGLRSSQTTINVLIDRGDSAIINLPEGIFEHTNANARVKLSASMADGSPLPSDVTFNPATGTLTVGAVIGEKSDELQIVLTAFAEDGQAAKVNVQIKFKEKARSTNALDLPIKLGKSSLAEQLRFAEKSAGHMAELNALSQAFAASTAQRARA